MFFIIFSKQIELNQCVKKQNKGLRIYFIHTKSHHQYQGFLSIFQIVFKDKPLTNQIAHNRNWQVNFKHLPFINLWSHRVLQTVQCKLEQPTERMYFDFTQLSDLDRYNILIFLYIFEHYCISVSVAVDTIFLKCMCYLPYPTSHCKSSQGFHPF